MRLLHRSAGFAWVSSLLWMLLIGGILFAAIGLNGLNPCRRTLRYSVGQFDDRFGISREAFERTLAESEAVWEEPMGADLFALSDKPQLRVNLIYDERQETFLEQQALSGDIDTDRAHFAAKEQDFLTKKADYDRRLTAYEAEVNKWNAQGGAPQEDFERLEAEQRTLNTLASELRTLADQLNASADTLNLQIDQFNADAGRTFDQGEFMGDTINIYQFESADDLRLVIAHEFGHALNLDHVENSKSIMYYLMKDQNLQDPKITKEDADALQMECSRPAWSRFIELVPALSKQAPTS